MTHTITTGPPPGQSGNCIAQYNHYILNGSKHNPNHHNPGHNPNHHYPGQIPNQSAYPNPYHQPIYQPAPNTYHTLPYYPHSIPTYSHYGNPAWTSFPGYY